MSVSRITKSVVAGCTVEAAFVACFALGRVVPPDMFNVFEFVGTLGHLVPGIAAVALLNSVCQLSERAANALCVIVQTLFWTSAAYYYLRSKER